MPTCSFQNGTIYQKETKCSVDEFLSLLQSSGLAGRRPVDDLVRLDSMLRNSNLVITARIEGKLVGLARCVTDFSFTCYLADLAVSKEVQGKGIGARLIQETKNHIGPMVSLTLNSVPEAIGFYKSIGMSELPDCYRSRREI